MFTEAGIQITDVRTFDAGGGEGRYGTCVSEPSVFYIEARKGRVKSVWSEGGNT